MAFVLAKVVRLFVVGNPRQLKAVIIAGNREIGNFIYFVGMVDAARGLQRYREAVKIFS